MIVQSSQEEAVMFISKTLSDSLTGNVCIVGLPRSGKSTLLRKIGESIGTETSILLKSGEFDVERGIDINDDEEILLGRITTCLAFLSSVQTEKRVLLVDSIKSLFFAKGTAYRRGGISNYAISMLNRLHYMSVASRTPVISIVSTTSLDVAFNQELLAILTGSSNVTLVCSPNFEVIYEDVVRQRGSLNELAKYIVIDN